MLYTREDLSLSCPVAAELVGDHHPRDTLTALQELAEEPLRRRFVSAALDDDVKHSAALVDLPPEIARLPVDLEDDFIRCHLSPRRVRRRRRWFA